MHWPHPPDLSMMLGRLLERSETTAETVREIRREQLGIVQRLADGDRKFDELERKLEERKGPQVSAREKFVIEAVRVALYLGVLAAAGPEIAAKLAGLK